MNLENINTMRVCKPYLAIQLLALLLAVGTALSLAACGGEPEPAEPPGQEAAGETAPEPAKPVGFINTLPIPTSGSTIGVVNNGYRHKAREMHELNDDTIGWLHLDNTIISEQVMWYPGDVDLLPKTRGQVFEPFYLRRDFNKVRNTGPLATQFGSYFADFRATFDGGWQGMTRNTTIYGHSMDDNPDGQAFSQLKKYLDPGFAKANPYIYFSLTDEDLAWEVFAVFHVTVEIPYHRPILDDEQYMKVIGECLARSKYDYGIEIGLDDKILTLSTCTYIFTRNYPNDYRYVVMARLVEPCRYLPKEAQFAIVENPKAP
jgi:sortase B